MEEALAGVVGDSTWLCSGGPGGERGARSQRALGARKGGNFILREIGERDTWENGIQLIRTEHKTCTELRSRHSSEQTRQKALIL